jgi:hypothetical protein
LRRRTGPRRRRSPPANAARGIAPFRRRSNARRIATTGARARKFPRIRLAAPRNAPVANQRGRRSSSRASVHAARNAVVAATARVALSSCPAK